MLTRARTWLSRRVFGRSPEVHPGSAHLGAAGQIATSATGYVIPPSDAPVDVQLRFVRERLLALESRIGAERQAVNQRIDRIQVDAQAADAQLQAMLNELQTKVRDVATGSVRLELLGLVLVGIGSIISTLPAVFGWS